MGKNGIAKSRNQRKIQYKSQNQHSPIFFDTNAMRVCFTRAIHEHIRRRSFGVLPSLVYFNKGFIAVIMVCHCTAEIFLGIDRSLLEFRLGLQRGVLVRILRSALVFDKSICVVCALITIITTRKVSEGY